MTDAAGNSLAIGIEERILAEHQKIRELGQRIENSRHLVELLDLPKEFRALLEPHFRSEEAPASRRLRRPCCGTRETPP